jgi:hypothetical protein
MAIDFNAIKEEYYSLLGERKDLVRERADLVRKIERSQDPVLANQCQSRVRQIDAKLASLKPAIDAKLASLKPAIEAENQRQAAEFAEKLAREKNRKAEEIAEKGAEFARMHGRPPYTNHCYQCKRDVNEAVNPKCDKCGWLICKCGSCECNMQFAM